MTNPLFPVELLRRQFPAFSRKVNGQAAAFLDGPGGTQVPTKVIEAVSDYLANKNANHSGLFATAEESDLLLDQAHVAAAALLNAASPHEVSFGQNMTSLTFAFSRALSKTWKAGDEIIVTLLDHDANVSPWVLAARDAGVKVHYVRFYPEDCTLDLDDFRSKLSANTKLVAVGCASNSVGSINPFETIIKEAHAVGAKVFLDAVHYAPHALPDVQQWQCDFMACSAYKFFGPHVGILWGRQHLMEELAAYKVRPAPNSIPGKWMTGTQNHEGIAGTKAAIEYLADVGSLVGGVSFASQASLRQKLKTAYNAISNYERQLCDKLVDGLLGNSAIRVYGITDSAKRSQRFATVSFTHSKHSPEHIARELGKQGLFVWHGNYYALNLSEQLGLEPNGMVRIGLVHYNTSDEVTRLLTALDRLS